MADRVYGVCVVFRLGVDFGTSHTVAVLGWPDGRTSPLLEVLARAARLTTAG